jgi:hypothetical protein
MSKTFRPWKIDEPHFLPSTVQDFVAEDHLARFLVSVVTEELDLTEITASYRGEKGHRRLSSGGIDAERQQNDNESIWRQPLMTPHRDL